MKANFLAALLAASTASAQVAGKVTVLEKDGVARNSVENLLVYLEGEALPSAPHTEASAPSITSRNKSFEPRAVAVTVGESVSFPNVDDIMHNVFSLSKGNRFDLGLYKSGAKKDFRFESPGLVRVYCNIHPQMSAFVQVLSSPYFAWADASGAFRVENVPPGNYTLYVWHEEGETSQPVMVTEHGAVGLDVALDVSGYQKKPHLNKFGKPYKRKRGRY